MSESNLVELSPDSLRYFCSNCGLEFKTHYGTQRHIDKSDCKAAGATVRTLTHQSVVEATQEFQKAMSKQPEAGAVSSNSELSEAEKVAYNPEPPWASSREIGLRYLTEEDDSDGAVADQPERDVPSFRLKQQSATLAIQPEAWVIVAYEAALRDGYIGNLSDWVHEMLTYLFVIQGIKIEVLATPSEVREKVLQEVGLADIRA